MQQSYGYYSRSKNIRVGLVILAVLHVVSLFGLRIESTNDFFVSIYPFNIIVTLIVLLSYQKQWNPRSFLSLFVIYSSGFLVEYIAKRAFSTTDDFSFRGILGARLFDVPLIMGIYWIVLIYSIGLIVKEVKTDIFSKCGLGAFIAVLYDIMLEPAAMKYKLWHWKMDNVPLAYYTGWFVLSYFLLLFFLNLKAKIRNPIAPYIFLLQCAYLLLMNML